MVGTLCRLRVNRQESGGCRKLSASVCVSSLDTLWMSVWDINNGMGDVVNICKMG